MKILYKELMNTDTFGNLSMGTIFGKLDFRDNEIIYMAMTEANAVKLNTGELVLFDPNEEVIALPPDSLQIVI